MSEVLPQGWTKTTLGEIAQPTRPRVLPVALPHLPFIGMEHVEAHTMRLLGSVPAGDVKSSSVHIQPGDVMYGRLRPYLNKVHVAQAEALCSAEFIVFPGDKEIDPSWLSFLLNSSDFVFYASHLPTGDRPRVDYDQIAQYDVRFPPRPEQKRIVAEIEKQLTRLDAAVAALKRVQANLKRYRASVLKAACEGRLVPTEAELARKEGRTYEPASELLKRILEERRAKWEADQLARMIAAGKPPKDDSWKKKYKEPENSGIQELPDLPYGWCWASIDSVAYVTKLAGFEFTKYVKYVPDGDLPVVKAENISSEGFRETSFSLVKTASVKMLTRSRLMGGDILMVFIGANLGFVASVPDRREFFLGPNVALIRSTSSLVEPRYVELYLRSPAGFTFTRALSKATAQGSISMSEIRTIPIAIPPLNQQRQIIATVDSYISRSAASSADINVSIERAAYLRQSILKCAFEGKLVPQDPNDEPASVLLERIRADRVNVVQEQRKKKSRARAVEVV